jgi:hypothetical protein
MATATATANAVNDATTGTVFSGWTLLSIQNMGNRCGVVFERSHDAGTTWRHIQTFVTNVEKNFYAPGSATQYRLRVVDLAAGTGILLRLED